MVRGVIPVKKCGMLAALVAVWSLVFFGMAPEGEATESFWLVARQIAPVMKEPGPYTVVEEGKGIEIQDDIEAYVYYGSRVTVAPVSGKQGAQWARLIFQGTPLGYVEKKALVPFPVYEPRDPEPYVVRSEKLALFLLPGRHPTSNYSKFFLPRGVTVTGIGTTSLQGKEWVLLRFSSVGASEEYVEPADVQTRYAWARGEDLIRLATYEPDLTRISPEEIPQKILTVQDPTMQQHVTFGPEDRKKLARQGFFIQKAPVLLEEIELDDLVEAYPRFRDHVTPLFLTADLGLHLFHLLFDRMLQQAEERIFAPALGELLESLEGGGASRRAALEGSALGQGVLEDMTDYLAVARKLLTGEGTLSSRGAEEYARMLAAQGEFLSPFSGKNEDYTLFRPRGHYTLSPALERYFRTMSFLGGVTFPLKGEDRAKRLRSAGTIALFCALLEDPGVRGTWKKLFDPFSLLVGASNDNSWYDYAPVVRDVLGGAFSLDDEERMEALRQALIRASRPPLILGSPAPRTGASQEEREDQALGFRLLGRRFTFDALVFHTLTAPATGTDDHPRNLPDPLDVLAVLGSPAALQETKAFEGFHRYAEHREALRKRWKNFSQDPLGNTIYSDVLRLYTTYFEPTEGGQFFAASPAWEYRKLVTAAASWAELKHDTVLYGEQSGAEMGDGGDVWYAPDFLFPEPRGYVEPAPRLFRGLGAAAARIGEFLEQAGDGGGEYAQKFATFAALMARLEALAEKEVTGAPLGAEEYRFIREFPAELSRELVLPEAQLMLYPPLTPEVQNLLRMALVVDVASDYLAGRALMVGVGAPRYLYVFVNDRWGGPRVTRGAVFSFYAFDRPLAEGRLTDEEWKKMVYEEDAAALDRLRPQWTRVPEK